MKNLKELVIAYPTRDWRIATVGDVAQVKGGKRLPKGEKFAETMTPFPYIRVTDFVGFCVDTSDIRYLRPETQAAIRRYTISMNDVYISIAGSIGITGMIPSELEGANLTENAAKLVVNHELVDTRFLMYFLSSEIAQREIRGQTVKNAQPKLALARVASIKIPIPPLPEQRKIAGVLGVVQRAMEQQELLLALTAELRKTLLHQLFTSGLRGEPQKQTDIGPVPQSWELVKLDDLFETQLGKMLSQKAHIGSDPKPYLRNKNVQWGQIDITDLLEMNFNQRERAKFILRPGDLLICEGGEPGRAAIWRGELKECYYQKALHRLRPKDQRVTNEYLSHWLAFSFQLQNLYGVAGASSTIAHLPESQLKALPIPLPKRSEQDEICVMLEGVVRKVSHHRRKHAVLTALFRTLLHQLMTAQIRVHDLDLDLLECGDMSPHVAIRKVE